MNKLTKGAIATAAGVVLLMGGAGTLASWNSAADLGASSTTINAGTLALTAAATPAAGWTNAANTPITVTAGALNYKIVPGDVLTYTATYNVAASGDNLLFTVAPTAGTFGATNTLSAQLAAGATFAVTGSGITAVTGATNPNTYKVGTGTSTITVKMTITFLNGPGSTGATIDNTAQGGSVTLNKGAVTLTQVAS